jgi:hypothetical protein
MVHVPKPEKVTEIDDDGEIHPAPDDADDDTDDDDDTADEATDDEPTSVLSRA